MDEDSGLTPAYDFDFDRLEEDIPPIVRAMDNVTDRTRYPLAEQRGEAVQKRRMGLGVTGLANAAEACGHAYGSPRFLEFEAKVLNVILQVSYRASAMLAKEKGPFPLFAHERYMTGQFIKMLDEPVRDLIEKHGLRNSHLTSIAPTGTISMCADNVSSSIEPVFSYETERSINTPEGPSKVVVKDYGVDELKVRGRLAKDVTAAEHVDVLITAQRFVDSAVSKTCNMDGRVMPWDEFKGIYRKAWEGGAKGCTTFNISGHRMALLKESAGGDASVCTVDPETGVRECA
jgi:ribonucleoside-diphosphate reductase alpha chain